MRYRYNPYCPCSRCRAHGYMWPAMLITIGVLFLLDQMGHASWMDFSYTWPALLIVLGVIKLLEHSASPEGHVPRHWAANMPPNVPPPAVSATRVYPAQGVVVTPPPVPPAGAITAGSDPEARRG